MTYALLIIVALAIAAGVDFYVWRRGDGERQEPSAYICFRWAHTEPWQGTSGPVEQLNGRNVRAFSCRRCGLVFGRQAPGR